MTTVRFPACRLMTTSVLAIGLTVTAAAPAAASVVVQHTDEISIDVNTCTGEDVLLQGTRLQVVRTFGDDGFAVRDIYTLSGTGQTTGTLYTVNVQSAYKVSNADTDFESTFRGLMVSRGPAPDQLVTAHISTDPDEPSYITTECRA